MRFLLHVAALLLLLPSTAPEAAAQDLKELARRAGTSVVHLNIIDFTGRTVGNGSGFFVGPRMIATNYHVIDSASRVEAVLSDQTKLHVLGVLVDDEDADLALLEIAGDSFAPLSLGLDMPMEAGESIVVLGSPLGLSGTLSEGIVSAVRENGLPEVLKENNQAPLLQITAAISPGSSGSPVMNLSGEVIGVAVSQMVSGQNLNFAVPVNKLQALIDRATPGSLSKKYGAPRSESSSGSSAGGFASFSWKDFPWHNLVISAVFFALLFFGYKRLQ